MTKYYCSCGAIFEHPQDIRVTVPDWFGGHYEYEGCCPECGDPEFTEAEQCAECGDWCNPYTMTYDEENDCLVCPQCIRERFGFKRMEVSRC